MSTSLVQDLIVAALSKAVDRVCESGDHKIPCVLHPTVELPKREEWGDFSSNVAMALAPKVHRPPIEIADAIAKELQAGSSEFTVTFDDDGKPVLHSPGDVDIVVAGHRDIEIRQRVLDDNCVDK